MHLSYLGPVSRVSTSWVSSGLTTGSGCSLIAARWQVFFPSWVSSGLTCSIWRAAMADDCDILCLLAGNIPFLTRDVSWFIGSALLETQYHHIVNTQKMTELILPSLSYITKILLSTEFICQHGNMLLFLLGGKNETIFSWSSPFPFYLLLHFSNLLCRKIPKNILSTCCF